MNREKGHTRVIDWTMACIGLHNLLHKMNDEQGWLEVNQIEVQNENENEEIENEEQGRITEAQQAGIRRREELRDLATSLRRH